MIKDLAIKSRSYRKFDENAAIDDATLVGLVDIARYCPSSVNMQPFKYYVSSTRAQNDKIFPLTGWARLLKDYDGPAPGERPTGYIVICTDTTIAPNVERFSKDVGIVAQTMLLAAVEQGLGGIMIGNFDPDVLSSALELPEAMRPVLIVAFGKPDETIVLEEVAEKDAPCPYYRDAQGVHHVPKRRLQDILL